MLDLFCGRFGWGRAFAARGWEVVGVDLADPPEIPDGCEFLKADVMALTADYVRQFDFVCASSPCEEFSVHGMKHFHPNPPFPDMGLVLFCHTRRMLERSGVPFVMENVRAAQKFVGDAAHRCGPFYLWGGAVPPIMPQGIAKGTATVCRKLPEKRYREALRNGEDVTALRRQFLEPLYPPGSRSTSAARAATIPPELSSCVADYAERIIEQRQQAGAA